MSLHDRAALAAGAAPGVADPVQPVTAELERVVAQPHRPNRDVMGHRLIFGHGLVQRQCIGCGMLDSVYASQPCPVCGASPFHLIPLPPSAA